MIRVSLVWTPGAAFLCGQGASSESAITKPASEGSFYVVGYAMRTSNADEGPGRGRSESFGRPLLNTIWARRFRIAWMRI